MTSLVNPVFPEVPLKVKQSYNSFEQLVGVYQKDYPFNPKQRPWTEVLESFAFNNLVGSLDAIKQAEDRRAHHEDLWRMVKSIAGQFGVSTKELREVQKAVVEDDASSIASYESYDRDQIPEDWKQPPGKEDFEPKGEGLLGSGRDDDSGGGGGGGPPRPPGGGGGRRGGGAGGVSSKNGAGPLPDAPEFRNDDPMDDDRQDPPGPGRGGGRIRVRGGRGGRIPPIPEDADVPMPPAGGGGGGGSGGGPPDVPPGGGLHQQLFPGLSEMARGLESQFQALAEAQRDQKRLMQHLEFQQAQDALHRARELESHRAMMEAAIQRNTSSSDSLNRTIQALVENRRQPNADFEAALDDFASRLAASQNARDMALSQAVAQATEQSAHRVLAMIDAMNRQQPSFEAIAAQNQLLMRMVDNLQTRQDIRSISPDVDEVEALTGNQPPPPPPPGGAAVDVPMVPRGRPVRSRSPPGGGPQPLTRANLERFMRFGAVALRAEGFRGTMPPPSTVAYPARTNRAASERPPRAPPASTSTSRAASAATTVVQPIDNKRPPSEPRGRRTKAAAVEVVRIDTPSSAPQSRARSSASSLAKPPAKAPRVDLSGGIGKRRGRASGGVVILPVAA